MVRLKSGLWLNGPGPPGSGFSRLSDYKFEHLIVSCTQLSSPEILNVLKKIKNSPEIVKVLLLLFFRYIKKFKIRQKY